MLTVLYILLAISVVASAVIILRLSDYLTKPGERYVYALVLVYGIICLLVIQINNVT